MIRFLFRSIGFLAIAAAFLLIIYDGTKSIAANAVFITTVRNLWDMINAASLASLRPLIETNFGRYAWDPAFTGFLNSPSWAVIGVLGIIFILLGRKRRPLLTGDRWARTWRPGPYYARGAWSRAIMLSITSS